MYRAFDEMPKSARAWVYQANRRLEENEEAGIFEKFRNFCEEWKAHGKDLFSSVKIYHHQFIVLLADENYNDASGCSIDTSVHFINKIEKKYKLRLLDKTKVAFLLNNDILLIPFNKVKEEAPNHGINANTIVFNNSISSKRELDERWKLPVSESWLKDQI